MQVDHSSIYNYESLLKGKTAVISIGGQGIGKATAMLFARQGAHVIIGARNRGKLEKAVEELRQFDNHACGIEVDYSSVESTYNFIEKAKEVSGNKIDILVSVVGINIHKAFADIDDESMMKQFEVNTFSVFRLTREFIKLMKKNGGGTIVNISSIHSIQTVKEFSIYAATKGALNSAIRSIALDYVKDGIRINNVAPGLIISDTLIEEINSYTDEIEREKFIELLNNMQPMAPGRPDDIAQAALFFASDMSRYITGQTLLVDGGASIIAHK